MGVTASTHHKSRVGAAFRSKAPEVVLATLLRQDDIEHLHAVFQYKTFHSLTPLHLGAKHSLQLLQLLLTHAGKLENEELFINSQHNAGSKSNMDCSPAKAAYIIARPMCYWELAMALYVLHVVLLAGLLSTSRAYATLDVHMPVKPTAIHTPAAGVVRQLVNARSDRGVTPLMLAASRGCYRSCQLLLSHVSLQELAGAMLQLTTDVKHGAKRCFTHWELSASSCIASQQSHVRINGTPRMT
jgi:hypothetical protein